MENPLTAVLKKIDAGIELLFEDTHLVVLCKPAGLLSQGDISGEINLVDILRTYFGRNYVGLVHRLDRNTSGLMVVAKRTKAANRLTEALQSGNLIRKYSAFLQGILPGAKGDKFRWIHYLLKDEKENKSRVVGENTVGAKRAELSGIIIEKIKRETFEFTEVEFELATGRSHQIRVQAAFEGFALVGDVKYGQAPFNTQLKRSALHSSYLEFPHPMSGESLKFSVSLPTDMALLKKSK